MIDQIEYRDLLRSQAEENGEEIVRLGVDNSWETWTVENLLEERPEKWALSLLASLNHVPVGYAIASRKGDSVHLHHLIVGPDWRGRGVGHELLRHLAAKARTSGARRLTLKVYRANQRAVAFYRRFGFHATGIGTLELLEMSTDLIDMLSN